MIRSPADRFATVAVGQHATFVRRLTTTDLVRHSDRDAVVLVPLEG